MLKVVRMKSLDKRWAWLAASVALVLGCLVAARAASGERIAIMIVSNKGAVETRAKAIYNRIGQLSSEAGLKETLPVLLVHFEKQDEREYCEQHLQISQGDLPFAGVVTLADNGVPQKVLYRIDTVYDTQHAAQTVFNKAQQSLGRTVTVTHSEGPTQVTRTSETTNPKDGSLMLLIPAGPFQMGSRESESERPQTTINLPAYYIGKEPVTNAQFRQFVHQTHYDAAGDWEAYSDKWGPQAPVVNVSWADANAYCQWAGVRLPTEAEWEKAARGTDGRKYPWGNNWDSSRCRSSVGAPAAGPGPEGAFPSGISPFGCLDMVGSVWQWCSSKYQPYPYSASDGREEPGGTEDKRVMRGGSWYNVIPEVFRVTHRVASNPGDYGNNIGFRVARTP